MNKRVKKKIKAAGAVLFVIYILALIYFLFFAERFGQLAFAEREYHYNLVLFQEIKRFWIYRKQLGALAVMANLLGNVVGFIPFGLILPIISREARGFFFITFSGFTLSLCVETVQLVTKLGCFDVDDILLNTIGGVLGYIVFVVCNLLRRRNDRKKRKEKR